MNIVNLLKDQLSDGVMNKISGLIGSDSTSTKGAIGMMLPKLMGGIADKASTDSGAESLLNIIKSGNHDGSILNNLGDNLSGNGAEKMMSGGDDLLKSIFGNKDDMMSKLGSMGSLSSGSSSKLMSLLAPMLMGVIGKKVVGDKLNASGLKSMLSDQVSFGANIGGKEMNKMAREEMGSTGGGGGFLKFLIPLILLGGLAWWFMNKGNSKTAMAEGDAKVEMNDKSSTTTAGSNTTTAATQKATTSYSMDANGNLVDGSGKIVAKAGEFTKDADGMIKDASGKVISGAAIISGAKTTVEGGKLSTPSIDGSVKGYSVDATGNLVDEAGKVVFKKGEYTANAEGYYVDKDGNKIGKILGAVGGAIKGAAEATAGAVSDAAGATADAFKSVFSGMFTKKDKVGATYTLKQIDFNSETHKITNFSKAEVEGLAQALKAHPDAKIQVQVHTKDGDGGAKNKKLSSLRAEVVEQMLITLGVGKSQISSKGMGDSNPSKSAGNKVEIMVEK